jgi:hypothetical protein
VFKEYKGSKGLLVYKEKTASKGYKELLERKAHKELKEYKVKWGQLVLLECKVPKV